jgi:hypothetical protein
MKITEAYYGLADVTSIIQVFVHEGELNISTNINLNDIFGDPLPGIPKKLIITAYINGVGSTFEFEERSTHLKFPCQLNDKPLSMIRLSQMYHIEQWFKQLYGLEIGGPSHIIESMGIYNNALLDCVNFSPNTTWSKHDEDKLYISSGGKLLGRTYIREATNLVDIRDNYYSFVVASHVLEHIANPLLALNEWKRVLKPDGILLLILPWKQVTFDHRRQVTPFGDLLDHYDDRTSEKDLSHLDEILSLHDLSRDPRAGTLENFIQRSYKNYENRCLHHHVFDFDLIRASLDFHGFSILYMALVTDSHQVVVARNKNK